MACVSFQFLLRGWWAISTFVCKQMLFWLPCTDGTERDSDWSSRSICCGQLSVRLWGFGNKFIFPLFSVVSHQKSKLHKKSFARAKKWLKPLWNSYMQSPAAPCTTVFFLCSGTPDHDSCYSGVTLVSVSWMKSLYKLCRIFPLFLWCFVSWQNLFHHSHPTSCERSPPAGRTSTTATVFNR